VAILLTGSSFPFWRKCKKRFDGKHLNRGGEACYIAKYIAKNIDSYVLEGEMAVNTQNATR